MPKEVFLEKKAFVLAQPHFRPRQRYKDYSKAATNIYNDVLAEHIYGDQSRLGDGGLEYVAFVGIRADEQLRVARIEARSEGLHATPGYRGEHVYMVLDMLGVTQQDVSDFWNGQAWDLDLPQDTALSNCVFCFLKGSANLGRVRGALERSFQADDALSTAMSDTPCDVGWWVRMERKYGRDLERERRVLVSDVGRAPNFVGFFGTNSKWSYEALRQSDGVDQLAKIAGDLLPCDCTD